LSIQPVSNPYHFNSPSDLAVPSNRSFAGCTNYAPIGDGSDLILDDVLSFEVKVLVPSGSFDTETTDPTSPYVGLYRVKNNYGNGTSARANGATGGCVFDTWASQGTTYTSSNIPLQAQIQALEITVRVWDFKTKLTRQMTIVKEL
jgi:hypothetical protein